MQYRRSPSVFGRRRRRQRSRHLGAALFMFLLVTMLNTFGASAGIRLVMTGLIIIAVIVIAGGEKQQK